MSIVTLIAGAWGLGKILMHLKIYLNDYSSR